MRRTAQPCSAALRRSSLHSISPSLDAFCEAAMAGQVVGETVAGGGVLLSME